MPVELPIHARDLVQCIFCRFFLQFHSYYTISIINMRIEGLEIPTGIAVRYRRLHMRGWGLVQRAVRAPAWEHFSAIRDMPLNPADLKASSRHCKSGVVIEADFTHDRPSFPVARDVKSIGRLRATIASREAYIANRSLAGPLSRPPFQCPCRLPEHASTLEIEQALFQINRASRPQRVIRQQYET